MRIIHNSEISEYNNKNNLKIKMNTEVKNLANIDSKSPSMDHSHNSIDKRRKMIENLKQDKLHQLKGTGKILDKIRQQKESLNQRISQSEDKGQLIELLNKQQNLVKKLNHENIELINQNCQFKQQIDSDKELIHSVNQLNSK